ncbi:VanW family protein [Candidatus Uhrbacteria bacterium]|jgi:vancomycin resistance protein VanW|nr:VanW family protein [Candidatus Uhrbacteria bacterium]
MTKRNVRAQMRSVIGLAFHVLRKQIQWTLSRNLFSKNLSKQKLDYVVSSHKTPYLRQLAGVDMQLQYNKIKNLGLAMANLNGLILEPGQRFSFWSLVGNPISRKGYIDGLVLKNGEVGVGIGGGLCQMTNLIYWITLHSPLVVVERWRHGYDVFPDVKRSQPFGCGATCSYPNVDLVIENPTTSRYQLSLTSSDTHLLGSWLSDEEISFRYTVREESSIIDQDVTGVYHRKNRLVRDVYDKKSGELSATEFVTENDAKMMYQPFLD